MVPMACGPFAPILNSLERSLMPVEKDALCHLTAGGMAKLNADVCRGIPFADSLADLVAVFERVQMRKTQAGAPAWGPKLEEFLRCHLKRRLTSLEMDYLQTAVGNTQQESFLCHLLQEGMGRGEDVDDVIEDVVMTAILHQIQLIVQRLRGKGKAVSMTALVRTLRPLSTCTLAEPSACGAALRVGVSPLVSWFNEEPTMVLSLEDPPSKCRPMPPSAACHKHLIPDDLESSCGITGSPQSSLEDLLQEDHDPVEESVPEPERRGSTRPDAPCPTPRRVSFREPVARALAADQE